MDAQEWQAEQFERSRPHLRAVAYRMLGSSAEAEDAVQETWLRLNRSDASAVENMRGWLTTVVSRICLDLLRSRNARREQLVDDWPFEPIVTLDDGGDPEVQALRADAVGLALLVVLEALSPPERLAFVLHDMFGMPYEEIAPIVERNVPATRQLASRARRRVRGARAPGAESLGAQRRIVDAFLAASRNGDFQALVAVLDPDVVFRADAGVSGIPVPSEVTGSEEVAATILSRGAAYAHLARHAVVNGRRGAIVATEGRVISVVAFTIRGDRIANVDLIIDPQKLRQVHV
jgi:RNA polymerase sigma-70 factor (ECF subfamily)